SGRGFYRYEGGKKRGPDPTALTLLGPAAEATLPDSVVERRLVLPLLNEAATALDEGVVRSPRDGDVAAVFGFGFPPFRGGPLRHADDLGAGRVIGELERLAERHGARFDPCEVLQEQARRGSKFYP